MSEELNLTQAVKYLEKAVLNAIGTVSTIDDRDINALLKAYRTIKTHMDKIEESSKLLSTLYNSLGSDRIPKLFESLEVDSVKLAGYNFILTYQLFASIPETKQAEGYKWLEDNGFGDLIKRTVHARALASLVKGYLEEHAIEPPDSAMSIHRKQTISMRKTS